MTDYKALAGRVERMARSYEERARLARTAQEDRTGERHAECAADLRTVVTMLEGMADAKPVAWMALAYSLPSQATTDEPTAIRWRKAGGDVAPLFTHPAPQPQRQRTEDPRLRRISFAEMFRDLPERQPVSEPCIGNNPSCPCQDGAMRCARTPSGWTGGSAIPQSKSARFHMTRMACGRRTWSQAAGMIVSGESWLLAKPRALRSTQR